MYINEDGYCYPSLETISNIYSPITGRDKPYDKSSMSKKIDRLESFGYVVKVKQQTTESGSFRSNLWRVIHDRELPKEFNRKSTVEKTTGKIQPNVPDLTYQIERTASNEAGEPLAHPALPENQPEGEVQNSFTNTELSPQKESAPAAPPPAARREIDPALLPETDDERYLFEQINIARVARHLKGQCRAFQTPQQRELFRKNNAYFNGSTRRKIDMQLARGKFDVRSILNGLDYERRNPPRASQAFGKPQAATYDENNLPPIPPHVLAKQGKKIFKDGQWFSVPE